MHCLGSNELLGHSVYLREPRLHLVASATGLSTMADDYETFDEWVGNCVAEGKQSWGPGNCCDYCAGGDCMGCTYNHPHLSIGPNGDCTLSRDVPAWGR